MQHSDVIKIGRIDFTNVMPVGHYFPYERWGTGELEWIQQVPTQLNAAMLAGTVDLGAISAFAYGVKPDHFCLLPNLSVSARGAVKSILFFSKKPLKQLDGCTVALPSTSATSVHLLKIILERFYQVKPNYVTLAPKLELMMQSADAALLIGDDALNAARSSHDLEVHDLGEEWFRHTNEWMTYAVWAVRRELAEQRPQAVGRLYQDFLYSKKKGWEQIEGVIEAAIQLHGGEPVYWENYFEGLSHDFGPDQWQGLQLYYQYAYELGYLPAPVELYIWTPPKQEPAVLTAN